VRHLSASASTAWPPARPSPPSPRRPPGQDRPPRPARRHPKARPPPPPPAPRPAPRLPPMHRWAAAGGRAGPGGSGPGCRCGPRARPSPTRTRNRARAHCSPPRSHPGPARPGPGSAGRPTAPAVRSAGGEGRPGGPGWAGSCWGPGPKPTCARAHPRACGGGWAARQKRQEQGERRRGGWRRGGRRRGGRRRGGRRRGGERGARGDGSGLGRGRPCWRRATGQKRGGTKSGQKTGERTEAFLRTSGQPSHWSVNGQRSNAHARASRMVKSAHAVATPGAGPRPARGKRPRGPAGRPGAPRVRAPVAGTRARCGQSRVRVKRLQYTRAIKAVNAGWRRRSVRYTQLSGRTCRAYRNLRRTLYSAGDGADWPTRARCGPAGAPPLTRQNGRARADGAAWMLQSLQHVQLY
jgi:hypothetical protein